MSLCHKGWKPLLTVRSVSSYHAVLLLGSAISMWARLKEQVGIMEDMLNRFRAEKIVTSKNASECQQPYMVDSRYIILLVFS